MTLYGKDFAEVYNDKWAFWGPKMWAFLSGIVAKKALNAKNWLDLCCGTGSLLKPVCKNGFTATGVDISEHQIKHARNNAPSANFYVEDIRNISFSQKFDVISCMFDSLNYLKNKRDLLKVFNRVKFHLSKTGLFVFDMNTFEGLQDGWCRISTTYESDLTLIVETSFNPKKAIGRCLITGFLGEGKLYRKFQEEHIERGYRAKEIESLLKKAGFSFKKHDGNSFNRPKKRSGRLLYICNKI